MNIEELDIKLAIQFLKTIGYEWDGTICEKDEKPTTICLFDCPQMVKLINAKNEEEIKGLMLYDVSTGDYLPYCAFYKKVSISSYVVEKDLTKEWVEFLSKNGFEF